MKKLMKGICLGAFLSGIYWLGVAIGQHSGKAEGYLEGRKDACVEILEKLEDKYVRFKEEGEHDTITWLEVVPETIAEVAGVDIEKIKAEEA